MITAEPAVHPQSDKLMDAQAAAYKEEYATHVRIWADLERKAQAMTAIAGTFVAAANALAGSVGFRGVGPAVALIGVLLLGLCALRSIQALGVRTVRINSAEETCRTIQAGLAHGADYAIVVNTYLGSWPTVIAEIEKANKDKAKHLSDAEALLGCAVFMFTLLTMGRFAFLVPPHQ